jgi:hypothetical protein
MTDQKPKSDWLNFKKSLTGNGRLLPLVERTLMQENAANQTKRDTLYLHPSEMCKKDWCPRSSYYRLSGVPESAESHPFGLLNIFAEGNAIHDKWQRWLADAGVLYGKWVCRSCNYEWYGARLNSCPEVHCMADHEGWCRYKEVSIFSKEYGVIGHSDGHIVDRKGEALLEIKSVGVGTLRFEAPEISVALGKGEITLEQAWAAIRYPFPSHIRQGQLYMFFTGIHTIVFIYECKWNQQVKEFTIHFDQSKIQDVLNGCLAVKRARERGKPPLKPVWATESTCSGCKKCPFNKVCWKEEGHEDRTDGNTTTGLSVDGEVSGEVLAASEARVGSTGHPAAPRRSVRRQSDGVVR